ncbi:hypothetical protein DFA_07442 [Cavenderia fasciculata]|uniref:F-box domain-containing protein n=1 Tax=Cavenderia fasciculata TaxID=261658 RepID=F4PWF5_CACFS|nr:uncharacterized protein DFA_07442 [Cavenderia fasciculata]EGG20319.1 hypothetical protein DFA_07442 [Cavenderia fasciculata]|eukprot:XP_004367302.1 hypothetical protein DFA_07442 [Cavenderia fasciculata]
MSIENWLLLQFSQIPLIIQRQIIGLCLDYNSFSTLSLVSKTWFESVSDRVSNSVTIRRFTPLHGYSLKDYYDHTTNPFCVLKGITCLDTYHRSRQPRPSILNILGDESINGQQQQQQQNNSSYHCINGFDLLKLDQNNNHTDNIDQYKQWIIRFYQSIRSLHIEIDKVQYLEHMKYFQELVQLTNMYNIPINLHSLSISGMSLSDHSIVTTYNQLFEPITRNLVDLDVEIYDQTYLSQLVLFLQRTPTITNLNLRINKPLESDHFGELFSNLPEGIVHFNFYGTHPNAVFPFNLLSRYRSLSDLGVTITNEKNKRALLESTIVRNHDKNRGCIITDLFNTSLEYDDGLVRQLLETANHVTSFEISFPVSVPPKILFHSNITSICLGFYHEFSQDLLEGLSCQCPNLNSLTIIFYSSFFINIIPTVTHVVQNSHRLRTLIVYGIESQPSVISIAHELAQPLFDAIASHHYLYEIYFMIPYFFDIKNSQGKLSQPCNNFEMTFNDILEEWSIIRNNKY